MDAPLMPLVTVKRVDDQGRIGGLEEHKLRDVLVLAMPVLDQERMDRWVKDVEDHAAKLARQLDMDPDRARRLVRDAAHGAQDAARGAMEAVNKLAAPAMVARESAEEKQAVRDVARAARRGEADWEPNPADAEEARKGRSGTSTSAQGSAKGPSKAKGSTGGGAGASTSSATGTGTGAGGP